MTAKKNAGIIFVIGGGILLASLMADVIGIGDDPGFGTQQTMGTIAGVAIAILGLVMIRNAPAN